MGVVEIKNSPEAAATASSSAPPEDKQLEKILLVNETYSTASHPGVSANGGAATLAVPRNMERRWFTCLYKLLLYIVAKHPSGSVANILPPSPPGPEHRTNNINATITIVRKFPPILARRKVSIG